MLGSQTPPVCAQDSRSSKRPCFLLLTVSIVGIQQWQMGCNSCRDSSKEHSVKLTDIQNWRCLHVCFTSNCLLLRQQNNDADELFQGKVFSTQLMFCLLRCAQTASVHEIDGGTAWIWRVRPHRKWNGMQHVHHYAFFSVAKWKLEGSPCYFRGTISFCQLRRKKIRRSGGSHKVVTSWELRKGIPYQRNTYIKIKKCWFLLQKMSSYSSLHNMKQDVLLKEALSAKWEEELHLQVALLYTG